MIIPLLLAMVLAGAGQAGGPSTHGDPRLGALIDQALERNPEVRRSFARYQSALQRLPQAGSLPDPQVGFTQYMRNPETRVGPQTTMFSVSQQFPWFGKLRDRERVAAKEAAVIREEHEARRAEVVRSLKTAYYDLAYLDRAIRISRDDLELLRLYETLAQARYSQGIGLQQAAVKLQAEITRASDRLAALKSRRVEVEAALNTIVDFPADSPVAQVSIESFPVPPVDYEELYRVGRERRPEVQAAFLQIERDDERIQLARKSYWPDFTVGAGFVNVRGRTDSAGLLSPPSQNGKNIYSLSVTLNIPIRSRKYDAAVLEATEDKIGSREAYRSVVNSMEASIRAAGFRIQTLQERIQLLEGTLLPQAELALQSAEAAYSTGTIGILDLLDSQRVLLDIRLSVAQLRTDLFKASAEMERTIGAPFPR